jgi:hypothetical protein
MRKRAEPRRACYNRNGMGSASVLANPDAQLWRLLRLPVEGNEAAPGKGNKSMDVKRFPSTGQSSERGLEPWLL